MPKTASAQIAVIGIDIGKNSFHVVGHDKRGSIVLRQKWSRGQIETRLANLPPCLIGMEACVGAHHLARKLAATCCLAEPLGSQFDDYPKEPALVAGAPSHADMSHHAEAC